MVSLRLLSKARNAVRMLENGECGLDKIQTEAAMRELEYYMTGVSHFDELSARGCIAKMYYYVGDTQKTFAPFVDYQSAKDYYERVKDDILDYNLWDFSVTLNLMYSDHSEVVKKWTKGEEKLKDRMVELAVSWLNDEDTNHPSDKIWWYMSCC